MGVLVVFPTTRLGRGFIDSDVAEDVLDQVFDANFNTVRAHIWPLHPSNAVTQVEYKINNGNWQTAGWTPGTCEATMPLNTLGAGDERRVHDLWIRVQVDVDHERFQSVTTPPDMRVRFYWKGNFTHPSGTSTATGTSTSTGTGTGTSTGTSTGTGTNMAKASGATPAPKQSRKG